VRSAMKVLTGSGWLTVTHGLGTYVNRRKTAQSRSVTSADV
jgi:DNA-binding FadR family transcriptional regulator